jgi:ribosome-associated protein
MLPDILKRELSYRTSRSGGPGGQHVNKVETKVEAIWSIGDSMAVTEVEKELIFKQLAHLITQEGCIQVTNQTKRTQLGNKVLAEQKLLRLVQKALIVKQARKPPRVSLNQKIKRVKTKRLHGEKKEMRRKVVE